MKKLHVKQTINMALIFKISLKCHICSTKILIKHRNTNLNNSSKSSYKYDRDFIDNVQIKENDSYETDEFFQIQNHIRFVLRFTLNFVPSMYITIT